MSKNSPLFIKARMIVNKYDPIHLLAIGCPKDEYDGEVRRILDGMEHISNVEKLHDLVYRIFVKMFDKNIAGPKENYHELTSELFRLK